HGVVHPRMMTWLMEPPRRNFTLSADLLFGYAFQPFDPDEIVPRAELLIEFYRNIPGFVWQKLSAPQRQRQWGRRELGVARSLPRTRARGHPRARRRVRASPAHLPDRRSPPAPGPGVRAESGMGVRALAAGARGRILRDPALHLRHPPPIRRRHPPHRRALPGSFLR